MNVPQCRTAEANRSGNVAQAALHQHHICRIYGNVRTCAYGNADIRTGKSGSVVYSVANHSDLALVHQLSDNAFLSVGKHACDYLINACLSADSGSGLFIVAREHYHTDAHIFKLSYRLRAVLLDNVRHGYNACKSAVTGEHKWSFALLRKSFGLFLHFLGNIRLRAYELHASAQKLFSARYCGKSVACKGCEVLGAVGNDISLCAKVDDRLCQRVLAVLFKGAGKL